MQIAGRQKIKKTQQKYGIPNIFQMYILVYIPKAQPM